MEEIGHCYVEVAHAFLEGLVAQKSEEDASHADGGEHYLADKDGSALLRLVD